MAGTRVISLELTIISAELLSTFKHTLKPSCLVLTLLIVNVNTLPLSDSELHAIQSWRCTDLDQQLSLKGFKHIFKGSISFMTSNQLNRAQFHFCTKKNKSSSRVGLTSHQTHYRSYWGRFLRVR